MDTKPISSTEAKPLYVAARLKVLDMLRAAGITPDNPFFDELQKPLTLAIMHRDGVDLSRPVVVLR